MMNAFLILHLLITIGLVGLVLIQRSEGGGLGLGGGGGAGGGFMTTRGTANILTRMTIGFAAAFFATSILLSIFAGVQGGGTGSVTDVPLTTTQPSPDAVPTDSEPLTLPDVAPAETPSDEAPQVPAGD